MSLSIDAQKNWMQSDCDSRKDLMLKLKELLQKNNQQLAQIATLEMGKLIKESKSEVQKCEWLVEHFAESFQRYLQDEELNADGKKHFLRFEALGVLLGIMPWNFPYWQIMRFAIPAICAGNSVLIKPALETPECALELEKLFLQAGFPRGIFQVALASHDQVASVLLPSVEVRGVAFTGSTEGGRKVYQESARYLKKVVLELGGSDPFIVFDDADLEEAVAGGLLGRVLNCGQSCIGSKRFFLHKKIYSQFLEKLTKKFEQLRPGNPLEESTTLAPLFSQRGLVQLQEQLDHAIKEGAKLRKQNEVDNDLFFRPKILENVSPQMKVYHQELFGPVVMSFSFESDEELVALCNDSNYGLGASLWGKDEKRLLSIASCLQVGNIFLNSITKSDPRIPFGGAKFSGLGKELGELGIKEFCNIKSINIV